MIGAVPELSTARLRLRRPARADARAIAALAADYAIARMSTRIPHPYSEDDAVAFLQLVEAEDPRTDLTWLIERDGVGPIGMLNLFAAGGLGPELGYWIGRPFWGQGHATEAVNGALRYADQAWRRKVVVAGHFADNPASGRVLEKAGFLYTGMVAPTFSLARGEAAPTRWMVRLP